MLDYVSKLVLENSEAIKLEFIKCHVSKGCTSIY